MKTCPTSDSRESAGAGLLPLRLGDGPEKLEVVVLEVEVAVAALLVETRSRGDEPV
jgi:hypothetical protein